MGASLFFLPILASTSASNLARCDIFNEFDVGMDDEIEEVVGMDDDERGLLSAK